jgi:hypothetical protein
VCVCVCVCVLAYRGLGNGVFLEILEKQHVSIAITCVVSLN